MKKGLTELVFILDRSGSMNGLEKDTIGGFNSLIEKQKKEGGEALVSTVLFDDESKVLYDRVPIQEVPRMSENEYFVGSCTALLDAIGGAIHHIGNVHKYIRDEDCPKKTLFVITTDGMENASSRYDFAKVKQMVEQEQEKDHWQFLFLGANIDDNLTNVEIYKRANIRRQLFSKIISNKDYQPKKETAIVLALAMHLNLDETKDFLSGAGYALSRSSQRDLVIKFFIENGYYNVLDIDQALYDHGLEPLSKQ